MWDTAFAFELPTSAPPTEESGSSSLLPTPSAYESTPTEEFVQETVEAGIQPDERLYLPGRKWHAQRTLSRIAPALLPTPGAWLGRRPENSMADPERAASREHEGTRGKRSTELPDAIAAEVRLPTPTAGDGKSSGSRNLPGSKAHAGVSLTDAVQTGDSETPRKLLPTPQAADGEGSRNEATAFTTGGGKRPSGHKATLTLPTATRFRGELSETPFASGNSSSDDQPPDQLTIEDA